MSETNDAYLANSEYAHKRRELLMFARELKDLGADSIFDIPKIVVIGSQSAGKSSLVEAVTGIKVPRDDGTCTRCPMECTILTTSSSWSCTISLRDGLGSRSFSPELTNKNDVEIWIRRAQATVLCPHLSDDTFKTKGRDEILLLTDTGVDTSVLKFTKSKVVIDIQDPNGADLAFVDLPGLIQNEQDDVVNLVKELVEENIRPESTIVLVTIPAGDDMENQQAMKLAKMADPKGERTIGVVTKPDTVGTGSVGARKKWQNIFEGQVEKHRLRLGYYCVRLPLDDERNRGISAQELSTIALRYFKVTSPWKDLAVSNRLGVENLVNDISQLLMRLLLEALPKLRAVAQEQLIGCVDELAQLPKVLTTDPTAEVIRRTCCFSTHMQDVAYGRSDDNSFVHRSQDVYRTLMLSMRRTAPDFRPFEDASQYRKPEEAGFQRGEDTFMKLKLDDQVARSVSGDDVSDISEDVYEVDHPPRDLKTVRSVIKDATGWELPHNVPYEAKVRLIRESVVRWYDPSRACFRDIQNVLEDVLYDSIAKHFGQFPAFVEYITQVTQEHMQVWTTRAVTAVDAALHREDMPYWTQNLHYLETERNAWLGHYKLLRHKREKYSLTATWRASTPPVAVSSGSARIYIDPMAEHRASALHHLKVLGYTGISSTDFARLIPPDEYEEELIIMADVRSYFQVAYKRVIDNVPEAIQRDLVEGFVNGLQDYLLGQLKIGTPDAAQRLAELLAEDPELAKRRADLEQRLRRLQDIKAKLDGYRF